MICTVQNFLARAKMGNYLIRFRLILNQFKDIFEQVTNLVDFIFNSNTHMDRSSFREPVLRQSYVFNTGSGNVNRSFISTSIVNDSLAYGDDLRKSRIQNLPNYKKTNLGQNLQFIVVFQTIEIERLSQQIQVLRVRTKEYERQLFNSQSYQVQIRELTQRCFSQEKEINEYREEYQKLNKICETLYHENEMLKNKLNQVDSSLKQKYEQEKNKNADLLQEIEKWKSRYQATEKSKSKELQDLRNMMESQRKSMIDRQIREMSVRFQNERSSLQNQIRKGRQLLDNRNRQIEDYKQKCQKYQITIMQLRNCQNLINDYENKLALINQQFLRLNQILKDKDDEIRGFKQRENKLNQQIKEQKEWEFDNKQLKAALDGKTKEADDWKARASRLEDQIVRAKELQLYNEELGNKLALASKELERLNTILRTKIDEIDQWKKKLNDRDSELSKYKNLENQLYNYESKINNLKIQNDRINGILKSRLGQIQDWKGRYNNLQTTVNNFGNLEKDRKNLQDRYNNQIKQNQELKYTISKLENDVSNAKKNESQLKDAERNNANLTKQIERLNNLLKNQAGQLNDFRIRYNKIENTLGQYKSIDLKTKDYENKIRLLTTELQKLNDLLKDRNKELAQLQKDKLQLYSKINFYKNYQIKIRQNDQLAAKMQQTNTNLKKDIDNWQQKYREADSKAREIQNLLFKNTQEKEKLNNMMKTKNNQYEELRSQYNRLEPQLRRKNEIQLTLQEQQNHMIGLSQDIEGYERKLKSLEQELEKQKGFTNQFAFKIIVLSSQIERLNTEGTMMSKAKSKQLSQIQQNYSRLQSKVQSKNNQIDSLINKISSLQNKITQLTSDYSRLLSEVQKSDLETKNLAKQIQDYQDYARRIHILGAEIDRLKSENKNLDEDIRKLRLKYSDNINSQKKEEANSVRLFLMAIQIQALRRRMDQREINVEQMRKSILQPVRRI